MERTRDDAGQGGALTAALEQVTANLGRLVQDHLALAKLELIGQAKSLLVGALVTVSSATLLLSGWLLLMGCCTALLTRSFSAPVAFLILASVNLLGGAAGLVSGVAAVRRAGVGLPASREELGRDRQAVGRIGRGLSQLQRHAGGIPGAQQ
ncbi:MAG: phage holin family protein [Deltaproteobacteria bacterium]